jgi:hypothetical protein
MSRWALQVIGFASFAGLLAAGCSPRSCGNGTCPTATFDLRALDDTTVTWTFEGAPPHTTTGLVSGYYPPSGTDCLFSFTKGRIIDHGDAAPEGLVEGFFSLACSAGDRGVLDFVVSDLGDFRDWSGGSFTIFATKRNFGVDGAGGCGVGYFDGMAMTVTVEAAIGGAAPYPKLVTDDFARTFRLEFDTSTVPAINGNNEPCHVPFVAQVSAHLTQTAADYVYDPNAQCFCE